MRFTVATGVRQVILTDGPADPRETRVLTERLFVFKNGVWSRQYRLRPLEAATVEEVPLPGELLLRAAGQG